MKSKIISIIIMLCIISSTIVIVKEAEAVPGNDEWGIATEELVYDDETYIDVEINTSSLDIDDYYVLYPVYGDEEVHWKKVMAGGSPVILEVTENNYDSTEIFSSSIILNVSGMWVLSKTGNYNGSFPTDFFWVNSTEYYEIELSKEETEYNSEEEISIGVTDGNSSVECWIDLVREFDGAKIFHRYEPDGFYIFNTDILDFAGNYTVQAYRDIDDQKEHGYQTGKGYYDEEYGSDVVSYTNYNYTNCGPWDPPEYFAENKQIIVNTKEPQTSIDTEKVYWSFDAEINITLEDFDDVLLVSIWNDDEENVTDYFKIESTNEYINIENNATASSTTGGWGRDEFGNVYGENGTWTIYLSLDIDGDGTEEWNTSHDFKVVSAEPVQWFWIDDDGDISTDNKDGIIPEIPEIDKQPLEVKFQIVGDDHSFYGDGLADPVAEAGKNITISGTSLFTGKLSEIPGVSYSCGTWTILLTPTMTSTNRDIVFEVNWEDYGSLTKTLSVGGEDVNGSIVTVNPISFTIDEDVWIDVSVFGPTGNDFPVRTADVYLYWLDDDGVHTTLINQTDDSVGNVYSFLFNVSEQQEGTDYAPRNILAYATTENLGQGYAKIEMKPKSDLEVRLTKNQVMAGEKTEFDISVFIGNTSEQPEVDDGITFEFYDSDGDLVTLNNSFGSLQDSDLEEMTNEIDDYFLKPGTYTIYAYNNTHDSTGHNATLIVKSVDVSCNKNPFIWKYDENISAMFTIEYEGHAINGTLRIYNINDEGDYYSTWVDTGDNGITFEVENGKCIIDSITANMLPDDIAKENITFDFRPDTSGSAFAEVDDKVIVRIADVSLNTEYLAYGQSANVEVTITGRGTLLNDVLVGIEIPGTNERIETETDSKGKAVFAFTPTITGKIKIFVEDRESDETIEVTAWELHIKAPVTINENSNLVIVVEDDNSKKLEGVTVKLGGVAAVTKSNGEAVFTTKEVSYDKEYIVKAEKIGYIPDEAVITILNVQKLNIILSQTEITVGKTFDVTVADDEGKAVVGALVIFDGKTYTTGGQGMIRLTAPKIDGEYIVKTSFGTYTNDSKIINVNPLKSTPGFELLSLIIAFGVTFILLKRRRR